MNEKNEVCVSNESRRHPEPSVLLSSYYPLAIPLLPPYYPLATLLLESTLNLRHEVSILNFFLLSIKFSTFNSQLSLRNNYQKFTPILLSNSSEYVRLIGMGLSVPNICS